jgi:hypothetical protein
MTIKLSTFQDTIDSIISADDNEISVFDRNELLKAGIERYSHDIPYEITVDVSGDGGKFYGIVASLTSWSEGFSQIISVEYPAATVASDEAATWLDPDDWNEDYWDGSTRYLYLPNHAPAAADAMRIRYTAPHVFASGATTVPSAHFYAVCQLCAGLTAEAIAAKYSRTSDSTISVDSVDHLSRAQQWADRARELIKAYNVALSIGDEGPSESAAGEFVDWDTKPSSGHRWLYHGKQ